MLDSHCSQIQTRITVLLCAEKKNELDVCFLPLKPSLQSDTVSSNTQHHHRYLCVKFYQSNGGLDNFACYSTSCLCTFHYLLCQKFWGQEADKEELLGMFWYVTCICRWRVGDLYLGKVVWKVSFVTEKLTIVVVSSVGWKGRFVLLFFFLTVASSQWNYLWGV